MLERFEGCMEKRYHTYAIMRFLNIFKYFHREEANEKGDIESLIE